jgi:N6-L-threonylcarbamoyladenine synthase
MNILGVETTCDETSLALVRDGMHIERETTVSQILKHRDFGGVVPDLGAREHLSNLEQIGEEFLNEIPLETINAVAIATQVGLPPALQVGESYAKGLAKALGVELIEVHHGIAHLWAAFIDDTIDEKPEFPFLGLIVSGKHSHIVHVRGPNDYEVIGEAIDDAIGEAFDKVAKMLGLPYPGGPEIEKLARIGDEKAIKFPIPLKDEDTLNLSFSGLKTAVRNYIDKERKNYPEAAEKFFLADVAASFQETAFQSILLKLKAAMKQTKLRNLVIGGGVAANQRFIDLLYNDIGNTYKTNFYFPQTKYCGDNASNIASYAFYMQQG